VWYAHLLVRVFVLLLRRPLVFHFLPLLLRSRLPLLLLLRAADGRARPAPTAAEAAAAAAKGTAPPTEVAAAAPKVAAAAAAATGVVLHTAAAAAALAASPAAPRVAELQRHAWRVLWQDPGGRGCGPSGMNPPCSDECVPASRVNQLCNAHDIVALKCSADRYGL